MKIDAHRKNSMVSEQSDFWSAGAFMRLAGSNWVKAWGEPRWSEVPDKTGFSFFVPDFFLKNKKCWLVFPQGAVGEKRSLFVDIKNFEGSHSSLKLGWDEPEYKDFLAQFGEVEKKLHGKELKKAVPVVFSRSQGKPDVALKKATLKKLIHSSIANPYGFWFQNEGLIGNSPEWLFSLDPQTNTLNTMALAGTGSLEKDLLSDEKEMEEHRLVVEQIEDTLSVLGQIQKSETYEWSLKSLKHLRTDISVRLNMDCAEENLIKKLIESLHPTPALGTFPKQNLNWLEDLNYPDEKIPVRRFGAPFGFVSAKGQAHVLVGIRNVQWLGEELYLGSGCGVVEKSQVEKEWQELFLKRNSVREALGL